MGKRIGYLRVSTREQSPDRQILGLQEICDELHIERISAVTRHRPVFEAVLGRLEPGDALVVLDLDRAFRSVIDAVAEADRLRERGITFHIVNLQVDTSTATGMFVYTVMSAAAEFERRHLIQRTKEGLAAARERGSRLGRPPKLSRDDVCRARFRIEEQNEKIKVVANDYHVQPWSLSRALRRYSAEAAN
jgi:DNA invertase Pin-like site-specific DNA recombinase